MALLYIIMVLSSIDTSLIIKVILLLAIHHVVLGLRLCTAIANVFGIHALHSTCFARFSWGCGVFVAVGCAGRQTQKSQEANKELLNVFHFC
jgi:hypothetical protein